MKRFITLFFIPAGFLLMSFLLSCDSEDFEPATITFYPTLAAEADEPAEGTTGQAITVTLQTSRVLIEDSQVNIRIEGNGAGYGNSYTTSPPQLEPGIVTLTIPRGEASATFTFTPKNDDLFVPTDYHYTFTLAASNNAIKSFGQKQFALRVNDSTVPFFEENFPSCPGTKFTERIASGVSTWGCSGFGYPDEAQTNMCREANAYNKGGSGACNTYLVSQVIDGSAYNEIYFNAFVYSRFAGNGGITFKYSTDYNGTGNPDEATWTNLDEINRNLPVAGSQVWKSVGQLITGLPDGPVYIAVHHQGGSTTSSSSWRMDNVTIKGN
ncbi:MAG TPA: choice-of-anchor J domain-containing protein [Cyclobacteriaceae bacterium]|nr:choice-of-anchor J domain-containing protein [Cyclobacteriaceae bacterium]